jgi:two-component system cell cycle sensor histidine kinase/response regulator CckA
MAQDDNQAPHQQSAADVIAGDWAEELRASEQQFWREFGRAPVGLVLAGLADGSRCVCAVVSDTYCELTGRSRAELSGTDFLSDFHPEDQPGLELLIGDVVSGTADQIDADARLVREDGELAWVRLTGSVISRPTGERYLAAFIANSTAAEQSRAEIQRLERELQRSRRLASLGQLVGGISHDFSNTLTVIANYASLVRDEVVVAETTESAAKWAPVRWDVEQIAEAADHAKRLIRHLLAFARQEDGEPVLLDLGQTIADATGFLGEILGEDVPVVILPSEGLWPVEADPGPLKQAIVNIALNARDAMPEGGQITIRTLNIDAENLPAGWAPVAGPVELLPGRYVAFSVTDTGTGMNAATAERAFDPFFTTKSGDQAAGLGLTAVRRFTAQGGGNAWIRSEPGSGTSVIVALPAAGGLEWRVAGSREYATPAGTVLVVDVEPMIRAVTHRVLIGAGYRVVAAANGHEALGLLKTPGTTVDLVLTDIVMPGMTGAAFADQVHAMRPGLPMLFMSGYEQQQRSGEEWPDQALEIVRKPFSRAALLGRVTQVLAHADQRL